MFCVGRHLFGRVTTRAVAMKPIRGKTGQNGKTGFDFPNAIVSCKKRKGMS
jgi:hypothetical protein